ncbi:MAG: hypothetical protein GY950_23695 [bacterium]|nr:hypothetical protein [bacterium]
MIEHLEPKPDADLMRLEHIFWDYNYPDSGQSLYDFVLGKKEIDYLDRNQVKARMLMTVGWYNLVDIFGLKNLGNFLTDEVLKWVWVDELRDQYKYAGEILEQALS